MHTSQSGQGSECAGWASWAAWRAWLGLAGFGLAWVWLAFLRISARFRFDFWIWLDFGWIWLGFQLDFVLDVALSLSFNRIFINSRLS